MSLTTNSYYSLRLHRTFNHGDIIVIQGQTYTSAYKDGYGYNYTVAEEKIFYGVYVNPNTAVLAPLCVADSYGNPQYYFEDSIIVGGGTPDTYTVSYNANGGSGAPSSQTKTHGIGLTLSSTKPSRTGYTFLGWSSTNDGTVDYYSGGLYSVNASVTLYAVWTPNTIKITLNANGGAGGTQYVWFEYGINAFYSDSECKNKITSIVTPTRTGYAFAHYYGDGSSGGSDDERYIYDDGTFANDLCTDISKNATLYAKWEINDYTLTVNPNGGTWNGSTSTQGFLQEYGTTKSISNPTRVGYTFDGWELNGYGSFYGQTYTYGAGNGELVAQWSRIVLKVTFDASANGGSPNSTRDVYYGDTIGSLPVPSKPFYKFIGWFTKAVGGTQISANNVITSNVTFYAQYKIDASIKVKYNGNKLPAIVWVKVNGVWKKCVTWVKNNGKWNKSTGAD